MKDPKTFRLILDPPRHETLHMAVDEMLMESQNLDQSLPTLRFYTWQRPAYSIGYFQNLEKVSGRFHCEEKKMTIVRRLTGGGLVLHGNDLTFSLALKNPSPFLNSLVKESYLKINEALRVGLAPTYVALDYADCKTIPSGRGVGERVCFEAPACYDLLLEGQKVVGASQRRSGGAILHQSSLFLNENKESLIQKILTGFKKQWGIYFEEIPINSKELELARAIEKNRYSQPDWFFPVLRASFSS